MPYPQKLLNDNETVVLDLHPHWWYFIEAAVALVISLILGILTVAFDLPNWTRWVCLVLIVGSALWMLSRFLKWRTTNFVVTSDRVIFRHGLFAKSGMEIPLERVNSVHFHQGIMERILGAGDLMIESGAELGQQRFTDVKHPDQVTNTIHQQMDANEDRMYGGMRGANAAAGLDVAGQLEKLEGMLQRGTITQDEFDSQKRKLLG
jgi:uncharacterized membrane protein YdbT with pleckstrin-like domain